MTPHAPERAWTAEHLERIGRAEELQLVRIPRFSGHGWLGDHAATVRVFARAS